MAERQELFVKEWVVTLVHLQMDQKESAGTLQVNASQSLKVKQTQLTPHSKACPVVSLGAQAITDYSRIQEVR